MNPGIFKIQNLEHQYNGQTALRVDTLSIKSASIVGLIGPNGSGKSTLLKLLSFIEKPTKGKIFFKGKPAEPFDESVRFRVTLLTQEPYLMKRSVFDNIAYGLKIRKNSGDLKKRVSQGLEMVGLLPKAFVNRPWNELSGGEAQRVALAARLVLKPEALLLDEPTASVDAASAQLIKDAAIKARQEWGTTLIIAGHDLQWLYGVCDESLHFFRGHILDSKMGNIVFGPWKHIEDNQWGKTLKGGQCIILSSPPNTNSVAMIKPFFIEASVEDNQANLKRKTLHGIISRMILEQSTGEVIVTVPVGNYPFTLKLTRKQVQDMGLYPGGNVALGYDPNAVKWY